MRGRGKKPVENQIPTNFSEFNYSAPDSICHKHPNSPPVGICPHCLRERLLNLICSVCGETKINSFCSCSSNSRNSSVSDVGSVGRISFLIENEKQNPSSKNPLFDIKNEEQRPNRKNPQIGIENGHVQEKDIRILMENEKNIPNSRNPQIGNSNSDSQTKRSGIWGIVKMFRKRRDKFSEREIEGEMWVLDQLGVSRSRSLCSYHESSSDFAFSSAKNSDFNSSSERVSNYSEADPRKSSFEIKGLRKGGVFDPSDFRYPGDRVSNFSEVEARKSDVENRNVKKKSGFENMDDSAFIDLKLDLLETEEKAEFSGFGNRGLVDPVSDFTNMRRGGSCRITVRDTMVKKEKRGKRVWGWISKRNSSWRSRSKRDDDECDDDLSRA